jgi:SAM-dependent methyltransferase
MTPKSSRCGGYSPGEPGRSRSKTTDRLASRIAGSPLRWLVSGLYAFRSFLFRQEWFNSVVMPAIPRKVRWALRRLYFIPVDLADMLLGDRQEMMPPKSQIFVGSIDDFVSGGTARVQQLVEVAGLTPESRVLDVGCGIGRLAIPLTRYLRGGSYEGLDIVPWGIEWCNEHIAARYPDFRFTLADVFNKEYNPRGRVPTSDYTFPYPDDTFDLIVLVSVFTHMLPQDTQRYVREIARV